MTYVPKKPGIQHAYGVYISLIVFILFVIEIHYHTHFSVPINFIDIYDRATNTHIYRCSNSVQCT